MAKSSPGYWFPFFSLLISACSEPSLDSAKTELTYYKDIRPILDARCAECHGAGIFPEFTPESVPVLIPAMLSAIETGFMPPWVPSTLGVPLLDVRAVSAAEKATLKKWAAGAMAIGLPSDYVARARESGFVPSRSADVVLKMPKAFLPDRTKDDEDRCFVLPKFSGAISAYQWDSDPMLPKHHMAAFTLDANGYAIGVAKDPSGDGYECPSDWGVPALNLLGAVGMGPSGGQNYPGKTSVFVPAGIVLQVHYLPKLAKGPGNEGIKIWLGNKDDKPVSSFAVSAPVELPCPASSTGRCSREVALSDSQTKAAHEALLTVCGYKSYSDYLAKAVQANNLPGQFLVTTGCAAPSPFAGNVAGMHIHAHTWMVSARLSLQQPDGSWKTLLDLPKWRYLWESSYTPRDAVRVEQGQLIKIECTFDNGTANQWSAKTGLPGHDAPAELPLLEPTYVKTGPTLEDEMCTLFFDIVP